MVAIVTLQTEIEQVANILSNLFNFRKKEQPKDTSDVKNAPLTWSFLGTDIHSHLIPGIDDGAQTIEDSLTLIGRLKDMGYKSLITTPHIKVDHYPNTKQKILQGLQELKQVLLQNNIDMPIKAAAEYYIDDHFMELLEMQDLLTIKDNEVLVELSFMFEPINFHDILFKIQTKGYRPILAHPERYGFYHGSFETFQILKSRGCLLQLNILSLTGYYGKSVKNTAEKLLHERLYDYCGTDMHHLKHAEALNKVLHTSIARDLTEYPFLNSSIKFE